MKEVLKWVPVILIVAILTYLVVPKYHFIQNRNAVFRCNKITGSVDFATINGNEWKTIPTKK